MTRHVVFGDQATQLDDALATTTMSTQTTRRLAAAAMAAAALLAIAGFTVLGSVFEYPQILESPTADILERYRQHQGAVTTWFLVLVISAALLAPAGILLGRLAGGSRGRWIARLGVAAAAVQVIGLSRWVLLVPGISRDATDPARTADAHRAPMDGLPRLPLGRPDRHRRRHPPRAPRRHPHNFAGYVAWCLWLIAMAVILWPTPPAMPSHPTSTTANSDHVGTTNR
jgi:hypothetical protein